MYAIIKRELPHGSWSATERLFEDRERAQAVMAVHRQENPKMEFRLAWIGYHDV